MTYHPSIHQEEIFGKTLSVSGGFLVPWGQGGWDHEQLGSATFPNMAPFPKPVLAPIYLSLKHIASKSFNYCIAIIVQVIFYLSFKYFVKSFE